MGSNGSLKVISHSSFVYTNMDLLLTGAILVFGGIVFEEWWGAFAGAR